jgi:hypothetical protein
LAGLTLERLRAEDAPRISTGTSTGTSTGA